MWIGNRFLTLRTPDTIESYPSFFPVCYTVFIQPCRKYKTVELLLSSTVILSAELCSKWRWHNLQVHLSLPCSSRWMGIFVRVEFNFLCTTSIVQPTIRHTTRRKRNGDKHASTVFDTRCSNRNLFLCACTVSLGLADVRWLSDCSFFSGANSMLRIINPDVFLTRRGMQQCCSHCYWLAKWHLLV